MSGMPMEKVVESAAALRMQALARYVYTLESEEIFAFLDALCPGMSIEDKEDIHDTIICSRDGPVDPDELLSAEEFFAELERERDASK